MKTKLVYILENEDVLKLEAALRVLTTLNTKEYIEYESDGVRGAIIAATEEIAEALAEMTREE